MYAGESSDFMRAPLQEFIDDIERGRTSTRFGAAFALDDVVEARKAKESKTAGGKIVVLS